jgi:hypothetical protein
MHHPLSPFSESLRTLRSSIHMSDVDQPPMVVSITTGKATKNIITNDGLLTLLFFARCLYCRALI